MTDSRETSSAKSPEQSAGRGAELGEAPLGKLLLKLSLPATVAMVVNGLYNMVDTIFIGRGVGTDAIGGLALIFPVQMLFAAFGLGIGQGSASVVSRNLGAKNYERARRAAGNAFTLALLCGLSIVILGELFMEPLLDLLGTTAALRVYARDYLRIILLGAPFLMMAMAANNLLRAEGKARASMNVMLVGALSNIILDPIFIFGLKMGVSGAALASIMGQFLNFACGAWFLFSRKADVPIRLRDGIPEGSVVKEILTLGLPTFIRQSGQSIVSLLLNNQLGRYGGDIYISAYGVVNRILMFLVMPLFGTVQGFQPIAGFNYGAGKFDRVKKVLRLTTLFATVYTTGLFLLLNLFPQGFAGIFTTDPVLIEYTVRVIRFIFLAFPLVGIQITGGTYFLVVGKSFPSLILNLSRQFLFLIPFILILPRFWGITGLLGSFPLADFLAAFITVFWLVRELRHLGELTPELSATQLG
ncbi:MAG: MATE family efflux transporter [Spirochaetales bacterium]|nr:MATE family efflux transporter [Spirochaetales bacterium]